MARIFSPNDNAEIVASVSDRDRMIGKYGNPVEDYFDRREAREFRAMMFQRTGYCR